MRYVLSNRAYKVLNNLEEMRLSETKPVADEVGCSLKQRRKTHGPGRLRANPEVENVGRARYGKFDECRHVALDLCKLNAEKERESL